jgi:tRNA nucleotidyltransferase/poly(A) polymerase
MRGRLEIVSAERIRDELDKLIVVDDPPPVLQYLVDTGLIGEFFPELQAMRLEQDHPPARRRISPRIAVVNNVAVCATQLHHGELVDQLARFLVAVLDGRALHEVRGWAEQRAADAAVLGDLAATEGVDDHAG